MPSPCKIFNKKKAITCYKLLVNLKEKKFDHHELFRISNRTPGEYYLFPIETLQKQSTRHISYHKSGAFHWRESDGQRIEPTEKEADNRRASLMMQAVHYLDGRLDGYCIARGRDVEEDSLSTMIEILDGYIIPPLDQVGTFDVLKSRKNHTIPLFNAPPRLIAEQLFQEDLKTGRATRFSEEDLRESLRNEFHKDLAVTFLEPKPAHYIGYSSETLTKVMSIAHELVTEKMRAKPEGFWVK